VFHADQEEWLDDSEMPVPNFDAGRIVSHLADILKEEKIWEGVLAKLKKPVYKIYYEDLVSNYPSKSKEIFDFLGIDISEVPPMPTRPMQKNSLRSLDPCFLKAWALTTRRLSEGTCIADLFSRSEKR